MPRRIPEQTAEEVGALFTKVVHDLHRYAMTLVQGDHAAAEDLVQEAFHDVALAWPTLRDCEHGHQRAWLFTVTRNKAIRRWKAGTRVEVGTERLERQGKVTAAEDTWHKTICALTLDECRKVLERMPPTRSRVAYLRWYEQWSTREIADLLGIARSTVRVHLKTARDELAVVLGSDMLLTERATGKEEAS
jgi:RNA polymerase sigma-70 factor (ECF subfamily)